ncbi:MAG: hypothetical protein KC615_10655 [Anaerolineae bacterium]|nr:hypothetical protein [Anaerolineae bacterium]
MRRLVFPVLMVILLFTSTTAMLAQSDATPASIRERVIISFPQGIYFELFIPGTLSTIDELTLTIQIDNQRAQTIVFGRDQQIDRRGEDRYAGYNLSFTEENAPALFDVISYTWQGTVGDQEIAFSGDELYADRIVDWTTASSNNGSINLASDRRIGVASEILSRYDDIIVLMQEKTQRSPRLSLAFYTEDHLPQCPVDSNGEPIIETVVDYVLVTVPCDVDLIDDILSASDYDFILVENDRNGQIDLMGPLVDVHYLPLWEGVSVPDWFRYGLQTFFEPRGDAGNLSIAQQAVRSGTTFRPSEMNSFPVGATILHDEWLAQAHGMVLYLASHYGVDQVFNFARSIGQYQSFQEAYEDTFSDEYAALIPDWEIWLFSEAAELAFGYTPYLESTPTLQPTPTITPSHVVPTPTMTATATPFMTDTPRPTRTPRPPTATLTPLPAEGFVVRPTATNTPTPEPSVLPIEPMIPGLSNLQLAILCGGGFIALLFIAIALASRGQSNT